jgi:GNAT superfamily N-acetyltransferase
VTPSRVVWRAGPDDILEVARLFCLFRDWFGRTEPSDNDVLDGVQRLIGSHEAEYLLVARTRGAAPEGFCGLRFRWGVWYAAPDCLLEDLYVADSARGAGLGAALLRAALERATERGCARMELDVSEENTPARRLYARFGFASGQPGKGRDLLMRRRLP